MKKIAFFNNKGGVGKSTSTINVAHAMARLGKEVLVVDCDNQQNTFLFFSDKNEEGYNLQRETRYKNLHILEDSWSMDYDEWDYAITDLPPALNERTLRILSACDYVFVPFELGKFAIQGIAKVTEAIATTGVAFGGCFVNKFDRENPVSHKLNELLHNTLGDKTMKTRIPISRVIKNSIDYRQTAFEYMEWTEAAGAYVELTKEIITICEEVGANA